MVMKHKHLLTLLARSMFAFVQVYKAINFVFELLFPNESLSARTFRDIYDTEYRLELCLYSTIFLFARKRLDSYRQLRLSIIATVYTKYIRRAAITTCHSPSFSWLR